MTNERAYKVIPFTPKKNSSDKLTSPWDIDFSNKCKEKRFCVVSTETGEILDDAQGYGYKTAQKAHAAYAYKTRDKSKDADRIAGRQKIQKWLKEHGDFEMAMEDITFQIAKGSCGPDEKFNADVVKSLLENYNLNPDFTANELLKVWRNS